MNHEERTAWLQSLKVGDDVYISGKYGRFGSIQKVVKITKTMIIVGQYKVRYRISGGFNVGGGSWDYSTINPVTDEVLSKQRIEKLCNKATDLKQKLSLPQLNEDGLINYIKALQTAHDVCANEEYKLK